MSGGSGRPPMVNLLIGSGACLYGAGGLVNGITDNYLFVEDR